MFSLVQYFYDGFIDLCSMFAENIYSIMWPKRYRFRYWLVLDTCCIDLFTCSYSSKCEIIDTCCSIYIHVLI